MDSYRVTAMKMGSFRLKKEFYGFDEGVFIEQPIWSALIQGNGRNIVVDTGLSDRDWLNRNALPTTILEDEYIPEALCIAGGIKPDDVDTVILTHLHFDHIGNNKLFRNAIFYASKTEYEFAFKPLPCQAFLYERYHHLFDSRAVDPSSWRLITKDTEVCPGINVIMTPGHTEGHISVLAETREGTLCIAGDAVNFMEAINEGKLNSIHISVRDCYESVERIRKMSDKIFPGHDTVISKFQSDGFPDIKK